MISGVVPGRGWRWLRVGEVIRAGDEFFDIDPAKQWRRVTPHAVGKSVPIREVFRRRVPTKPSRKPGDVEKLLKQHAHLTHARAKADFYSVPS